MVRIGTEKRMAFWQSEVLQYLKHSPSTVCCTVICLLVSDAILYLKRLETESGEEEIRNYSKLETSGFNLTYPQIQLFCKFRCGTGEEEEYVF